MATFPKKLTYRDYLLFPDDGRRHELIDGEHFVTPSRFLVHQVVVTNLCYFFGNYLDYNLLGQALIGPFEVVLSDVDVVQPDFLFVSNERENIWTENNAQGAPDLMIEVLSDDTRETDEVHKLRLYERADVREYWIFDPDSETARVYRRDGDRLIPGKELSVTQGDTLESSILPGLRIPLVELFDFDR